MARYASYLAYGASFFAVGASFILSLVFLNHRSKVRHRLLLVLITLVALLFSTPLVYELVTIDHYELGIFYPAYVVAVIVLVAATARNFIIAARNGTALQKSQSKFIMFGITVTISFALITNALIPALVNTTETTIVGPLFSIIFVGSVAYAIIKHRLFDIRFFIARSVAYALLISTLALLYVSIIFAIARVLSGADPSKEDIGPFVAAMIIILTAPSIKQWFDRLTNALFFRDTYDAQTFLDVLNKTLVSNIEIGILLRHTAAVIKDNFKAECYVYVNETDNSEERVMGTANLDVKPRHLNLIKTDLTTIPDRTVVMDELGEPYLELKNALYINKIAVISSLITSYESRQEATAYLILGPKMSGSAYSKQDIRLINIIADELLIAIQNALRFEEIQDFNITLQNRINDATGKLKRSNDKLKDMDETKDEFISMASHQLRTPLTSVKGYLSMVLEGDAGKITDNQRDLLNQAYISSQRMVYLIADLLNVSRLKTGKFVINLAPTDLIAMVESEIAQLTEVAKGKDITVTFNKPADLPELQLDETKTRQVVMNFVDNAIYYTPRGGKVKIELRTDRSSVYFMVKDNGMGVPKAEQAHLFTKFYRAKNAQKARPDGTGLGLFMAKRVISEQGGTILFESVEGKGSTFGFKFDKPSDKSTKNQSKK